MISASEDYRQFDISLADVVLALGKNSALPLVWAEDVGALYLRAKEISASAPDKASILDDEQRYLDEGMSVGDVMALDSLLRAMTKPT